MTIKLRDLAMQACEEVDKEVIFDALVKGISNSYLIDWFYEETGEMKKTNQKMTGLSRRRGGATEL